MGEVEDTLSAHTSYFADFMAERAIDIKGRRQYEGLNEIAADFDNVIGAWYHALDTRNDDALLNMMEGIALYCDMHARYGMGIDLFDDAYHELDQDDIVKNKPVWRSLLIWQTLVWTLPADPTG